MAAMATADSSNDREARFLASRSSRTAERTAARESIVDESSASTKLRDEFWSAFRERCSSLHRRIDALGVDEFDEDEAAENDPSMKYITAAQRNEGKITLDSISTDLGGLRRACGLGASTTANNAPPADRGGDDNDEIIDSDIISSLPPGDLRFLANDLSRLSDRVAEAREVLCPREVFTFKRYRAAIAERDRRKQLHGGDNSELICSENEATVKADENNALRPDLFETDDDEKNTYGMTVCNRNESRVIFEVDGTIHFHPLHGDYETTTAEDIIMEPATLSIGTSVLLKCLKNCQVLLKGNYQSIHLFDLEACDVSVARSIAGPAHLTQCRNSTFRAACHQFRMHDSNDFTCHLHVGAGPIIEGCKGIVFYGDYYRLFPADGNAPEAGENKFREVKDFNWLRTMVKSPNFEVKDALEEAHSEQRRNLTVAGRKDPPNDVDKNISANTDAMREEDSSDEDEL